MSRRNVGFCLCSAGWCVAECAAGKLCTVAPPIAEHCEPWLAGAARLVGGELRARHANHIREVDQHQATLGPGPAASIFNTWGGEQNETLKQRPETMRSLFLR